MESSNNKGKSVTTSVPSIAIKFHANAEELEDFYQSDEESTNHSDKTNLSSASQRSGSGEPDSSPLKYFPKLVKRSTSIDVSTAPLDLSPPSDPWRFFSDIKGKITKSVEEKITEIKQRNSEESSPSKSKPVKNIKESSSVSDSEDLSESSISKTCGVGSTTEGVEMSSEEEASSFQLDKDKPETSKVKNPKQYHGTRFRTKDKNKVVKEGSLDDISVSKLVGINKTESERDNNDDIESAVDALEDTDLSGNKDELLKQLSDQYKNIEIDDDGSILVDKVTGEEVRHDYFSIASEGNSDTVYSPTGFVDLRHYELKSSKYGIFFHLSMIIAALVAYTMVHRHSSYFAGMSVGIGLAMAYNFFRKPFCPRSITAKDMKGVKIHKVEPAEEIEPVSKYEGWINEYPEEYDPLVYHISYTQTVFLRLQGNLLRISHTKAKIPKRATWNERDLKPNLTYHRVYNLRGAKISLLPAGLNKKRHWSKKYPICITLNPDMMNFDTFLLQQMEQGQKPNKNKKQKNKKEKVVITQRFSKLNEDDKLTDQQDTESSRPSSPSLKGNVNDQSAESEKEFETYDEDSLNTEDWSNFSIDESPTETKLYLFGRTGREKEDWFRKFAAATHKGARLLQPSDPYFDQDSVSDTLLDGVRRTSSYLQFMMQFKQLITKSGETEQKDNTSVREEKPVNINKHLSTNVLWLNAMLGRVLFDCMRDNRFSEMIRDKIWRKMTMVKLPYFIEELNIVELNMGSKPPIINKIETPYLDDRGLWIDMDINYEGSIVCTIQTQLNLMKLKQEKNVVPTKEIGKSAMFHSDVEDSAESSSDDEVVNIPTPQVLDASGQPVKGLGGQSRTSRKFVRIVDKIAESKFFQAASENKYVKRAMEGVSNTDLRLSVTIKKLAGIFVLNIPPPPSDRLWLGFRPVPELIVTAQPIVGERNISFMKVTSWIEHKIVTEFQKIFVLPNMDDLSIPVMSQDLPE